MGTFANAHEVRANHFFVKGKADFQKGDYESCIKDLQYAQQLFATLNSKELAAESMLILSHAYLNLNQKKYAIKSFNEAYYKFKEINDKPKIGECALKLGSLLRECGDIERSENFLSTSLSIFKDIKDVEKLADAWKEIGNTYLKNLETQYENFEKVYSAYKNAIELYKKSNCTHKKALTELDLALLLISNSEFKETEKLLLSSLKYFKSSGDDDFVVTISFQLSRLYLEEGKKKQAQECYEFAKNSMKRNSFSSEQIDQMKSIFS